MSNYKIIRQTCTIKYKGQTWTGHLDRETGNCRLDKGTFTVRIVRIWRYQNTPIKWTLSGSWVKKWVDYFLEKSGSL